MLLKSDSVSLILNSTTNSQLQWTCTSCLRRSHLQLRKASASTSSTSTPRPRSKWSRPLEYYLEDEIKPKALKPGEAPRRTLAPPPHDPNKVLTRAEKADLKRPPLAYLDHVVGSDVPPKVGQNPAKDRRSFGQRVSDYWTREAHEERTRKLTYELSRGYYKDIHRTRKFKGKTWVAPEQPFQASVSKYFPNFQGYTYADQWSYLDTSKLLTGKISVVSYARERWAKNQADSFVADEHNPELARLLEEHKGEVEVQRLFVNFEEEWLKKIIMYLFFWYAKRTAGNEAANNLVVTSGIDREFLMNHLGIMNTRVGHVYLVDAQCKIRWVGNGDAYPEEKEYLVTVMKRLIQERKSALEKMKEPLVKKAGERKDKAPRSLSSMMMK